MAPDIVVRLRATVALHHPGEGTCWGRPNEVLSLPLDLAAPLIRTREAVLVDQGTPVTRQLPPRRPLTGHYDAVSHPRSPPTRSTYDGRLACRDLEERTADPATGGGGVRQPDTSPPT